MLLQLLLIAVGTAGLFFGADWLVQGAARLARSLGMSATVVGLTVVAFGTSMPEFVVGVLGGSQSASDLVLGNVVGSNIVNIALILGVTAMIFPIPVQLRVVQRELPIMIAAMIGATVLALDGTVGRIDSVILLSGFVLYMVHVFRAKSEDDPRAESEFREFAEGEDLEPEPASKLRDSLLVVAGLAVLIGGAHVMVESAVALARGLGVSEVIIGLTIVAMGTSLPELATGVVAALRKQPDIAVGNVVGSNVFNALAVLGVATAIEPARVEASILAIDLPLMILLSLLLLPIARRGLSIRRWEGAILVGGYALFTLLLWVRP